jgi:hypothetical protein
MQPRSISLVPTALLSLIGILGFAHGGAPKSGSLKPGPIPRTWDEKALATLEVPLADPKASPVHVTAEQYYRLPVRPIYKSYPIYHPSREPQGYWEWLQRQEPRVIFDAAKLKAEAEWVRAGETVFDAPSAYDAGDVRADMRDPNWFAKVNPPLARDGTLPFRVWVVREKGKVEAGVLACAECHTRAMRDGSFLKGAPGNFPFDRDNAWFIREHDTMENNRRVVLRLFGAPWVQPNPLVRLDQMSREEMAATFEAIPPGILARHRSSFYYPMQVGDLIGVRQKRYLDASGLNLHRSVGDLMRYAALNQGADALGRYGDFVPMEAQLGKKPDAEFLKTMGRYSDEQLYALAKYLYSLKPPPNPNKLNAMAERGRRIFAREACGSCHTPPLYTNNKLTPADGFMVPPEHQKRYDILPVSVGTDPNLTLRTARGTGYYKIPSLRGLWYRGPYLHDGSCATLEDLFDRKRLRDDYVPTGFKGYGVKARAVKGHVFGLNLSEADRKALIAFLKTV